MSCARWWSTLLLLLLPACGGGGGSTPPPPPTYTVTFLAGTGGSLAGTTTQAVPAGGSASPVTAVPATGQTFVNWTGPGFTTSATNPLTVANVQSNLTLTANFTAQTFTVTFLAGGGGSLGGSTSQTIPYGGSTTAVTALPAVGHTFGGWTGSGFPGSLANPFTVTNVTQDLTLTASFPVQTFTVTFTAGSGGTLTGTTSQTVAYGTDCTAVTANPNAGYAFTQWAGTGFTPSTANPLTVTHVTQDLALTASFTSLIRDLTAWLTAHPAVASAIQWQFQYPAGGNAYTPPGAADLIAWSAWSPTQKADLDAAYQDAVLWLLGGAATPITLPYRGVSDAPTNWYSPQADAGVAMQWTSPTDMWKLYIAHVGFSLALETTGSVPWSLTTYDAQSLRYLLDSSTMGWELPYGPVSFSLGTYGGANLPALRAHNRPKTPFTHPMWTYQWMKGAGIPAGTKLASIGGVLEWMRQNMVHFYGTDDFSTCNAVWQYKGYPPISRIIGGTVDANNPGQGTQHWTLGCHGSVGFLAATLRSLNIPVQPIWVGGHELACFLTERQYLDHGDDPYHANVRSQPGVPILNLLIDEATYQSRFSTDLTVNVNSPSAGVLANIGKAAADFH